MKTNLALIWQRIKRDIKDLWFIPIFYVIYRSLAMHFFNAACPFLIFTGLPCAGCGMTRCFYLIFSLQLSKAFYLNPVSFLWFAFIIWFGFSRYILGKKYRITTALLIIICLLTLARYVYGMVNYFPDRIPYVRSSTNLFSIIVNK